MEAAAGGWKPSECGAEAQEMLGCMSWMGRQSTARIAKYLALNGESWDAHGSNTSKHEQVQ